VATPIVLVAVAAAAWQLRKGQQIDAILAIAMFSVFVLLPVFWGNPWGGDSPGARYLTPALPFLGPPLVWSWRKWPRVTFVAAGISIVTMVAATITDPLMSRASTDGLGQWLGMLVAGDTVDTLPSMVWGSAGWIVHLTAFGLLFAFLVRLRTSGSRSIDHS
jgi:hypothetical protein